MAERVRRATRNGQDLIDFWIKVFRDETEKVEHGLQAAEKLEHRGFGNPLGNIQFGDEASGLTINMISFSGLTQTVRAPQSTEDETKSDTGPVIELTDYKQET
jgi:hypothetical protein